jgi:hypothetical protein
LLGEESTLVIISILEHLAHLLEFLLLLLQLLCLLCFQHAVQVSCGEKFFNRNLADAMV